MRLVAKRVIELVSFAKATWTEHQALAWITNIMLAVHVGLGVAVLAGGPQRFAFPTYQPLIDMVNGATWV